MDEEEILKHLGADLTALVKTRVDDVRDFDAVIDQVKAMSEADARMMLCLAILRLHSVQVLSETMHLEALFMHDHSNEHGTHDRLPDE